MTGTILTLFLLTSPIVLGDRFQIEPKNLNLYVTEEIKTNVAGDELHHFEVCFPHPTSKFAFKTLLSLPPLPNDRYKAKIINGFLIVTKTKGSVEVFKLDLTYFKIPPRAKSIRVSTIFVEVDQDEDIDFGLGPIGLETIFPELTNPDTPTKKGDQVKPTEPSTK